MSKNASLFFDVTVPDDCNVNALAEAIFDFLSADPDDLFPQIETVNNYDYQENQ